MSGRIQPRAIYICDRRTPRRTSIRLEDQFWFWLRQIAAEQGTAAKALIEAVEKARTPDRSLSSALRVYVTRYLHDHPLGGAQC
jgi:predicted DNA-binding ribbon-helix-helix protein